MWYVKVYSLGKVTVDETMEMTRNTENPLFTQ